ncbi:MAG: NAD(P)H-dependent oxidoreductase, partial [Patescibacteria group bacterium]
YIFVTPEYNAGYPAPLKNALDYLYKEWQDKLAGIISYGGRSGGKNSANGLVKVLNRIGMKVIEPQVNISRFSEKFDKNGNLTDQDDAKELTNLFGRMPSS